MRGKVREKVHFLLGAFSAVGLAVFGFQLISGSHPVLAFFTFFLGFWFAHWNVKRI